MKIRSSLLATIAFVAATAPIAAQQSVDDVIRALERQLAADAAADTVGGMSAGVIFGDSVVWARGFGWAERETGAPAHDSSVYRVGSISKSVTAVLMMIQAERNALALDDPIARYLQAITELADYPTDDPITFRDLASHTSGLIREPALQGAASGPMDRWEQQILASIPTTRVETAPGAAYSYSNIGFGILGLAVSRAAGDPFMDLVTEQIFEPLEMTTAGFRPTPNLERHLAAGYVVQRDGTIDPGPPAREHGGRGYKVPNGAVYASVYDLAKFIGAMSGVLPLLSKESRGEMLRIQTPEGPTRGYGLGFSIVIDSAGNRIAGHGGSVAGYNATMQFDPEARIGVVILRAYNSGETNLGRTAIETVIALREARGSR